MKHLFFSLLIVLGLSVNSWAQFVAGTGFEDPAVVGSVYTDLIDVRTDHALADNSGEPVVNFTALGSPPTNEIGFTSFYTDTRGSGSGIGDGDTIGVSSANVNTGSNSFSFNDPDGLLTLTTDSIDISTSGSVRLSLWYFINNTGFESNDNFFASISVDGGSDTFITFREAGGPVVGNDIEGLTGAWTQAISPVFSGNSVVLTFGVDFNSETETLFLDDIGVSTIPEPSTYALILGGLAIGVVIWKRRRS